MTMGLAHNSHDEYWLRQQFAKIPEEFHAGIRAEYTKLYQSGAHQGEGRRKANNFILLFI